MSASVLLWGVLFGSVGFGYFVYGKKQGAVIPLICGIVLMAIPYFIKNPLWLALIGTIAAVLPFVVRK